MNLHKLNVAIVLLLATSLAVNARSTRRELLADPVTVSTCTWFSNFCGANPVIALSEPAADDQAKLAQKVAAMYYTCTKHSNSTQCNADIANNCQWTDSISEGMCISNPNSVWEELLVCPGSVMAQVLKCRADSQEACAGITGCKWTDVLNADISLRASKAVNIEAFGTNFTIPTGMCWPEGVPTAEYNATAMAAGDAVADAAQQFTAALYGSCAGVDVLKGFAGTCSSTLNETACKADKLCKWDTFGSSIENAPGACDFTSTGRGELMFTTTASAAFNTAMAKAYTDCRAAENATQCGAVGTVQIQDSKVAEALSFVQPAAKSAAAGVRPLLHLLMGAVSVGALLVLSF